MGSKNGTPMPTTAQIRRRREMGAFIFRPHLVVFFLLFPTPPVLCPHLPELLHVGKASNGPRSASLLGPQRHSSSCKAEPPAPGPTAACSPHPIPAQGKAKASQTLLHDVADGGDFLSDLDSSVTQLRPSTWQSPVDAGK